MDKKVLYTQHGRYCLTDKANYKAPVQDRRKIFVFPVGFESVNQCVMYLTMYMLNFDINKLEVRCNG